MFLRLMIQTNKKSYLFQKDKYYMQKIFHNHILRDFKRILISFKYYKIFLF